MFLVEKNGSKMRRQGFFVHADAGIGDGEDGARLGGMPCLDSELLAARGGDSQLATVGHGGAGIVGQVHENEGELFGIDEDGVEGFIELQFDGDVERRRRV